MTTERLPTLLRELIASAKGKPLNMNLMQIAKVCDVQYDRLWRFTRREDPSDKLLMDEYERIRTRLAKLVSSL